MLWRLINEICDSYNVIEYRILKNTLNNVKRYTAAVQSLITVQYIYSTQEAIGKIFKVP